MKLPRSGETMTHRLIASHSELYTLVSLWEVLFAPALCQKYLIWGLYRADAVIGAPAFKEVNWVQAKLAAKQDDIHSTGLTDPEKDHLGLLPFDGCFLHVYVPLRQVNMGSGRFFIFAKGQASEVAYIVARTGAATFGIQRGGQATAVQKPQFHNLGQWFGENFPRCEFCWDASGFGVSCFVVTQFCWHWTADIWLLCKRSADLRKVRNALQALWGGNKGVHSLSWFADVAIIFQSKC